MIPVHPGRVLRRELRVRGLTANRLALQLRVPSGRIIEILNGKRAVSAEPALRLGRFLGTGGRFWVMLQARYDLALAEERLGARVSQEVPSPATP